LIYSKSRTVGRTGRNVVAQIRCFRKLVISKEADEPGYLLHLYKENTDFRFYQVTMAKLAQSAYNNLLLKYRHFERFNAILDCSEDYKELLDVGCGFGDLAAEPVNENKEVIALDLDRNRLRLASIRCKKLGLVIDLLCGDAERLPLRVDSVDVAYSNQVIEHVTNPSKLISEMLRVSRVRTVIISGNAGAIQTPVHDVFRRLLLTKTGKEHVPDVGGFDSIGYINAFFPL
jgi:SAM-dependent methyltransferase